MILIVLVILILLIRLVLIIIMDYCPSHQTVVVTSELWGTKVSVLKNPRFSIDFR